MRNRTHPDTEYLDRYRAGLLDDRSDEKHALEEHLAGCPHCRGQLDSWAQLAPAALGPRRMSRSLSAELLTRRNRAMTARSRHHIPLLPSLATAAALACAVGLGLWVLQPGEPDSTVRTAQSADSVPDIYEDLDFYLWLANEGKNNENNDTGNANRT